MRHSLLPLAMICSASLTCLCRAQQSPANPTAPATLTPALQTELLESVEDAKSVEDLDRVRRYAFEAELRFFDKKDGKPIKGVPISVFGKRVTSDDNGIARVFRPAERGVIRGLDRVVPIADVRGDEMLLTKNGEQIDSSRLVVPYTVRAAPMNLNSNEKVHIDVALNFDGLITRGKFDVNDSALGSADQPRRSMRENAGVLVDSEYRGGVAYQLPGMNVALGPLPYVPDRGYILFGSSALPVKLGENFNVCAVQETLVQRVDVEWTDPKWFIVTTSRFDTEGASLMRVSDGFVTHRGKLIGATLTAPVGKYVVLPGRFVLNLDQKTVAGAIIEGIDVTQFGLQVVEVTASEKSIEDRPAISIRASVFDARASIARIREELEKRKADKAASTVEPPATPPQPK